MSILHRRCKVKARARAKAQAAAAPAKKKSVPASKPPAAPKALQ